MQGGYLRCVCVMYQGLEAGPWDSQSPNWILSEGPTYAAFQVTFGVCQFWASVLAILGLGCYFHVIS